MPAASSPSAGRVLSLGGKAAFSSWGAFVAAFLASAVASLATSAAAGLVWLFLSGAREQTVAVGALGLGLLWLTARLVRAIALGAGVLQASDRLRGSPARPSAEAAAEGASRSIAWFVDGVVFDWLRGAWQALALAATGYLYLRALVLGQHGLGSAVGLALAATVAVALWIAVRLWLDVSIARALSRGESFLVALYESAGALWDDPWRPLAILVITGVLAALFEAFAGLAPGQLVGPGGVQAMWATGAVIGAAVVGFVDTGAQLLRLGALAALELGRSGSLPEPPTPARAEPILQAEIVVDAKPLSPSP